MNLKDIVTVTTVVNPHNTDGDAVAVYSRTELTVSDIEELYKEYRSKKITRKEGI